MNSLLDLLFRWIVSEAKKDGVDSEISKYDGNVKFALIFFCIEICRLSLL